MLHATAKKDEKGVDGYSLLNNNESSRKTGQDKKMKRKHGGTVYATISVIRDFEDVEVEVSGYYEPEQNGGWDDPVMVCIRYL